MHCSAVRMLTLPFGSLSFDVSTLIVHCAFQALNSSDIKTVTQTVTQNGRSDSQRLAHWERISLQRQMGFYGPKAYLLMSLSGGLRVTD